MIASPVLDQAGDVRDLADGRDAERPGDDGDVARRPALLEHEAAQRASRS